MSQAISRQHPAVVLRSHYAQLRNLLAVAMIAIVGLSGAVVILANEQDDASSTTLGQGDRVRQPGREPPLFRGRRAKHGRPRDRAGPWHPL